MHRVCTRNPACAHGPGLPVIQVVVHSIYYTFGEPIQEIVAAHVFPFNTNLVAVFFGVWAKIVDRLQR